MKTATRQAPARASAVERPAAPDLHAVSARDHRLLTLQRLAGNRAVAQEIGLALQPKLVVGDRADAYEREADRTADAVLRSPQEAVQRVCAECEEEMVQRAPAIRLRSPPTIARVCAECEEEEELVQRAPEESTPAASSVATELEERIRALRGRGEPLHEPDRSFYETRMRADFSAVRIHRGPEASALAGALGARAFTVGPDVAFAKGERALGSVAGRRLLAHELAHVVQQGSAPVAGAPAPARAPAGVQRQEEPSGLDVLGAVAFGGASGLAGLAWLALPRWQKKLLIDVALASAAKAIRLLPDSPAFGVLWPLFKAGLEGFVARLRSPKVSVDEKIAAMDKLAGILAGFDVDFILAALKGLAHGFFVDGMLGIFILIYDLLKAIPKVWAFLEQVGEAIAGFPDEISALIERFIQIYDAIVSEGDAALEEIKKWASDPQRVLDLLSSAAAAVLDLVRTKSGDLAEGLVKALNQPGSAKALGQAAGRITGTIVWEVLFVVLTAGGGAAVTAAKAGLRTALGVVTKLVGRVVGGFLKLFNEIRVAFSVVGGWVRKAAKAIKGKFAAISERFAKLLDDIGEFFAMLLRNCRESKLVCTWPRHHPLPKYLGGLAEQTLKKIPKGLHYRFHSALDKWKGGILGRTTYKGLPFETVVRELRQFYKSAEGGIFAKYLPDFEQAVRETRAAMKGLVP